MKGANVSAEIISVGSELLLGHIVNTNASYLARKLAAEGINLFRQAVVGDNPARLCGALREAMGRSDIIITSGGLGPTVDDITIKTIAEAVSRPLVLNKTVLKDIRGHFAKRNMRMPADNERQAYMPKGAIAVKNPVGTAPGSIIKYKNKAIVALPGPPRELIPMFENSVIPCLRKACRARSIILTRTIRTTGMAESAVNKKIERFLKMDGAVTAGIYASLGEVDIKITAKSENRKTALSRISKTEKEIIRRIGGIVYGFDGDTLESVVGKLLRQKRLTLAVAESCTGGLISNRVTNIPGSSAYFRMGIITYSNESKIKELGVSADLIKKRGAVSREIALAMARGMLKKSGGGLALAVTGIAGPGGGTAAKPVGLVYIALAGRGKTNCIERRFKGNRADIKLQASSAALDLLRTKLRGH